MDAVISSAPAALKLESPRADSKPAPGATSAQASATTSLSSTSAPSLKPKSLSPGGIDLSQPANYRMALLAVSIVLVMALVGLYAVLGGPKQSSAHDDPDAYPSLTPDSAGQITAGNANPLGQNQLPTPTPTNPTGFTPGMTPGATTGLAPTSTTGMAAGNSANATAVAPGTYRVQAEDNLWSIARKAYGDARAWSLIAQANPRVDPNRLRVGMTLQLPDEATVRAALGAPRATMPAPAPASTVRPASVTAATTSPRPAGGKYVVVLEGDTLMAIARRELGNRDKWELIYRANRDRIRNPNVLPVGMRLRLPQT